MRPCGLMDKALVFGTKDCRFESCQGHSLLHAPCLASRRVGFVGPCDPQRTATYTCLPTRAAACVPSLAGGAHRSTYARHRATLGCKTMRQFARVVKGVDLRSTGGNSAWVRTPQLTYRVTARLSAQCAVGFPASAARVVPMRRRIGWPCCAHGVQAQAAALKARRRGTLQPCLLCPLHTTTECAASAPPDNCSACARRCSPHRAGATEPRRRPCTVAHAQTRHGQRRGVTDGKVLWPTCATGPTAVCDTFAVLAAYGCSATHVTLCPSG